MKSKNIKKKYTWLITGVAGFIGSHLAESLLKQGQTVIGLDNLSACGTKNLDILDTILSTDEKQNFNFIKGDIRSFDTCETSCKSVDFVLHHAAIGSVPHSFEDPVYVNSVNIDGFLNILQAAISQNVKQFVYASSSAVYGDYTNQPNQENQPLKPLSPYAVSKYANELYTQSLSTTHEITCTGLRYFNVYGSRQDPNGAYAAVIPKWIEQMKKGKNIEIYGNGNAVRDFCFISDVINANINAALYNKQTTQHEIYNIASGTCNNLNELFDYLNTLMNYNIKPTYKNPRKGDIHTSCADITKAKDSLMFSPEYALKQGLRKIISDE